MAKKLHQPTRMCVACRRRDAQKNLFRLRCEDQEIGLYPGFGRSFYLCQDCLKDQKKVLRSLMRECRGGDKDKHMNKLKEIITDDRES
jgi:predicted RNA-binding protein YlxR (DUF448 family)